MAERLTTGSGLQKSPAVSPDGSRLAYTAENQSIRLWSFPLDASAGRISGEGMPITEEGARVLTSDLSRDGGRIAYVLAREGSGRDELWVADLRTNQKQLVSADETRRSGFWSRDGTRLAYRCFAGQTRAEHKGKPPSWFDRLTAAARGG